MTLTLITCAPFARGERILDRRRPDDGCAGVTSCVPQDGGWIVHYERAMWGGSVMRGAGPADHFVPCPDDWCEFPERPVGEVDRVLRSSTLDIVRRDGRRAWAEQHFIDAARKRDLESGFVKKQIAYYRDELVRWWAMYASRVNPEIAREQAVGIAKMADLLEEEAREEASKLGVTF
jgi:hypothetical protein